VTHEMSFAREVCNRIAFMQAGRIVELGAPSEIFNSSVFERTRSFMAKVH
ncbi:MAG: ectoine/hydroxyectoine ABC transporter ATP-binding protein EhuA, partial [Rhizobium oryzihabitans]